MTQPADIHQRFIFVYDKVIPASLGAQIISLFDATSCDAVPMGGARAGGNPVKRHQLLYIDRNKKQWQCIDNALHSMYGAVVKNYFASFPWLKIRYRDVGYFVKKYAQKEGYYHAHVDASVKKNSNRILASILYLNTVTSGGETEFTNLDLKIQPVAGRLLLFPPMWMYPHRAVMPQSHDKYTVNTFFVFDD